MTLLHNLYLQLKSSLVKKKTPLGQKDLAMLKLHSNFRFMEALVLS